MRAWLAVAFIAAGCGKSTDRKPEESPSQAPSPAAEPSTEVRSAAEPAKSSYVELDAYNSVSVVSTKQSARLPEVAFEVDWIAPVSETSNLVITATPDRSIYFVVADRMVSNLRPIEHTTWGFDGRKTTMPVASGITIARHAAAMKAAAGGDWRPMSFESLSSDPAGNLYAGASYYGADHAAYVTWRADTAAAEPMVGPNFIAQAAAPFRVSRFDLGHRLAPGPGDAAWLFVWQTATESRDWSRPGARAIRVERAADGSWKPREVPIKFELGGAKLLPPLPGALANGSVDAKGGWVFYDGAILWRMATDGVVRPLAVIRLAGDQTTVSAPLVLPSGDVWFAVNRIYSTVSSTNSMGDTRVWALVGDRSRLVRLRFDGKGGLALAEISSERFLAALRAKGHRNDSGVMKSYELTVDPATGGIAGYDGHHNLIWVIVPR